MAQNDWICIVFVICVLYVFQLLLNTNKTVDDSNSQTLVGEINFRGKLCSKSSWKLVMMR